LSIIRRHITPTKAGRANRKGTAASLVSVIIPAYVNIQRNIRRPATRHGIRYRLPINRIVISVGPVKAEIGGHIAMRHAFGQKKQKQPKPDDLKHAPTNLCQFSIIWYVTHIR
jgi:hypothetical protein